MCKHTLNWVEDVTGEDHGGCCIFGDITSLLPYGTFTTGDNIYSRRLLASRKASLAQNGQCYHHGAACDVQKRPIFTVSGLPCPDMSTAGKRRKRAGVTADVYLAHGRWASMLEVPLILFENTKDGFERKRLDR